MPDENPPRDLKFDVDLPSEVETGVFADFANIWHTPNTFVLDFLSVKAPVIDGPDEPHLPVKVAARVRIPPEQIFPLIEALTQQSQRWLQETGRSTPPDNWGPQAAG